jgi:transposase
VTDRVQAQPNVVILALDQMSLYFQATLTRVWSPIGQPPVVRITPQRDNIHFYGALDVRTGRDIAVTSLEQTTEITADFLRLLLLLFPTPPMLLLLDRAPWHHGPAIDQVLEENPRLELLYFPPACPDLNPQEHIWKQARQDVGHNHEYALFSKLIDAFEAFLNETPFSSNFMSQYAPPIYANSF